MATIIYKQGEFTLRHMLSVATNAIANHKVGTAITLIQEADNFDVVVELTVQPDWTVKESILTVQKKKALDNPSGL